MKNYVSTVISKINNKTQRKEIEAELQAHIDDRIDYYVNAGYDLETATQKANEHMGDTAELVGDQLNFIGSQVFNNRIVFLFVLFNLFIWFFFAVYCIVVFDDYRTISENALYVSSAYLIYVLFEILISIKIKRSFLAFSSIVLFMHFSLVSKGYVPVVFCIYQIAVGRGKDLGNWLYCYDSLCANKNILKLCYLFVAFCILISLFAFVQIIRFRLQKNGRNYYKAEKYCKNTILALSVFIILICIYIPYSFSLYSDDVSDYESYEGIYLIESDEIVNPEKLENYDDKQIRFSYELFGEIYVERECISYEEQFNWSDIGYYKNHPIRSCDYQISYIEYDDLFENTEYKTDKILAEFYTDKKYVMIVPMLESQNENEEWYYHPDFSKGKWFEVSNGITAKSEERELNHWRSFLEYEIKIIPN